MHASRLDLIKGPAGPSRWLALVVLCAGMLMIILDQTIVNVALPAIQRDLGFSQSSLAWVVNAYLIPFGGLLLLAGRLGDLLGRKRILISGLVVFTAASLLCGVAGNQQLLISARFVQAPIGGYHLAFGMSAGLVLSSIAVAATVVRCGPLFTPADRGERAVVRAASENPVGHSVGHF